MPQTLETIITHRLWETRKKANGADFAGLADYLLTNVSGGGLGCENSAHALNYEQIMKLCEGHPRVEDALLEAAPKRKRGGSGSNQHQKKEELIRTDQFLRGGPATNSTSVLKVKLEQQYPEVWADFRAGKHATVYAAAKAAGLVKDANAPLYRLKCYWKKASEADRRAFLEWLKTPEAAP